MKALGLTLFIVVLVCGIGTVWAQAPEWEDPQVTDIGTEAPHAFAIPYPDRTAALAFDPAKSSFYQSLNVTINGLLVAIAPLIVTIYCGLQVVSGRLTIGDLVAISPDAESSRLRAWSREDWFACACSFSRFACASATPCCAIVGSMRARSCPFFTVSPALTLKATIPWAGAKSVG